MFEAKKNSACSRLFQMVKYNIEKAKTISPKGLMDFILFMGLYFCLGGGLIQAHAWLRA